MASSIPDFLANMTLATSPQASFEQADSLLLQAAELRQEAIDLQARIDALNERANVLHTTATGLQAIATQDRAIIQSRFNLAVELHTDYNLIYGPDTNKSTRFHQLEPRIEDGLATMEEVENFIDELQSLSVPERSERSKAPEPETPDSTSILIPSVESAQTTKNTPSPVAPLHKRKLSSTGGNASSAKRLKQTPMLGPERSSTRNGDFTNSLHGSKEPEAPTHKGLVKVHRVLSRRSPMLKLDRKALNCCSLQSRKSQLGAPLQSNLDLKTCPLPVIYMSLVILQDISQPLRN
jgi:hypothetical protein